MLDSSIIAHHRISCQRGSVGERRPPDNAPIANGRWCRWDGSAGKRTERAYASCAGQADEGTDSRQQRRASTLRSIDGHQRLIQPEHTRRPWARRPPVKRWFR
ncbi:hypothetical protein MLP_03510 [Microlunatus phosphovorus NM-1]|uniref:Uncharacterized protein n=1 Tax=Microlunatus phosphovorus (strain ATCC 700054 / DSM 10555 / JCM 9379 / NBRC 101784 / NCIMB 13414 / VKM Ac-1990 / NM-1) TaxID=1032480 RepID=F5XJ39_MICPN|nr:hypothetical protein MLP_03510 [Microlunatus phosphovorus NM-1]